MPTMKMPSQDLKYQLEQILNKIEKEGFVYYLILSPQEASSILTLSNLQESDKTKILDMAINMLNKFGVTEIEQENTQ